MPPIFWVQKQDIGPSERMGHGLAYDAARARVIVFGGDPGGAPLDDTWAWDGALWTQVSDIGPSARHGLSLVDHAASQRLILFGGASGAERFGDTWAWDGADWVQVEDSGPSPRHGHGAAYDPTRQRTVLFGGDDGAPNGDTWEWDGTNWVQVQDVGPSARLGHAMAWDAGRGRVILFGGAGADGAGLDDTWAWDGANWTQIANSGPDGRAFAAASGGPSVLLFGGVNSIDPALAAADRVLFDDTWQLTAQGWTKVQDIGPAGRFGAAAASRPTPAPSRAALFGGSTVFAAAEDPALVPGLRNDTWEVPDAAAGGGANNPPPPPPPPPFQIQSVTVQPNGVPSFAPGFQVNVIVTASAPPPAGTTLSATIVRNNVLVQPPGFQIQPSPPFNGASTSVSFQMSRDGTFLSPGGYGVQVTIGALTRVGPFSIQ